MYDVYCPDYELHAQNRVPSVYCIQRSNDCAAFISMVACSKTDKLSNEEWHASILMGHFLDLN